MNTNTHGEQPSASAPTLIEDGRQLSNNQAEHASGNDTPSTAALAELHLGYAWAAGFLDGEGCISLARIKRNCGNRINYRARVHVPQNCAATLDRFRSIAGENCCLTQLPDRESYTRPIYQLNYDGIHASRLLHKLRPYLVRKAAEADVIFEYYRDGQPTRHFGPKGVPAAIWYFRERCFDALRCLK